MKKLLLGIPFILILIILAYLFVSMYVLNKEEVYYGQVSNDNGLVKTLVSNDSDNTKENFQLTKDDNLNVQKTISSKLYSRIMAVSLKNNRKSKNLKFLKIY
ncbi:hypothetical protein [Staphylococcus agnetis]|uniref:hypothetical protein n=1 Tax=Staphylococcus agnetis TaxID=985762 RepID=UPI000D1A7405|nr:hypothetical protein [Staphylococcus agnetis]NJH68794.1 hypothetical protein [Staphylococcus agnetis]PTH65196.1 hypothetical protein BU582_11365 [Staphylococcus agnetis]